MYNTIENIKHLLIEFNTIGFFTEASNEKLPKCGIEVLCWLEGGIDDLPNFLKTNESPPPIIYDLTTELEEAKSYLYKFKLAGILEYNINKWLFFIYDKYPSLRSATIQEQHTTAKNKPRKQNTISDFILLNDDNQKQKLLTKLHTLIDGKKGKYVAFVIRSCVEHGLMNKPKFPILVETFGNIGNVSGYRKYYNLNQLTEEEKREIKGIDTHILPFKDNI